MSTEPFNHHEYTRKTDQDIALIKQDIAYVKVEISKLVNRDEFTPVKLIAYGLATAVFTSVLLALLSKVLIK